MIVDQKQEDIAVRGIKRGRVAADLDIGVVDPGRPIEHTEHLPACVAGAVTRDTLLFISGFAVLTVVGALLWIDRFGLTDAQVGYSFGIVGIVLAVTQGLVGPLVARIGEKPLLVTGLSLMAVALAAMPVMSPEQFIPFEVAAIAVFAVGYAFAQPTGTALVASAVDPAAQGQLLGQYQAVAALGRIVAPLIGSLAYQFDPALPFFIGAALILLAFVVALGVRVIRQAVPA